MFARRDLIFVASCLSAIFAVWGTFAISREDFSITHLGMSVSQGHFKDKNNNKIPSNATAAEELAKSDLLSNYDVQLRSPFVDVSRYYPTSYDDKGDWSKYQKRHHVTPTATFTYDMTQSSDISKAEYCYQTCTGQFFEGPKQEDATYEDLMCFVLIPGCIQYYSQFYNADSYAQERIGTFSVLTVQEKGCTDKIKMFKDVYLWAIVGLWVFIFMGNIVMQFYEFKNMEFGCFVLLLASAAVVAVTVPYAVNTDELVHVKIDTDTPVAKGTFQHQGCYGSYYTNLFGYTTEISNDQEFTFVSDYFSENRKPSNAYKQPFRRGPRQFYMIFAAVVGLVHVVVYVIVLTQSKKGGEKSSFGAMQHLASTLF